MEFELKYAITDETLFDKIAEDPAVTGAAMGAWRTIPMEAVYYDTPDLSLGARKWMVRGRSEGGEHVVTCKTPGEDGHSRGEWECEGEDVNAALPVLVMMGAPEELMEAAGTLIPCCGSAYTRRALMLELPDCVAELALDRGRLFRGEAEGTISELELELKDGDPFVLMAFAAALAARYGLSEEPRSKFARARSL